MSENLDIILTDVRINRRDLARGIMNCRVYGAYSSISNEKRSELACKAVKEVKDERESSVSKGLYLYSEQKLWEIMSKDHGDSMKKEHRVGEVGIIY